MLMDVSTGAVQPIHGPVSDCTVPSSLVPTASNIQFSSEFQYLACKEYRSRSAGTLYYRLEPAIDGEYIRLLAPAGQSEIDAHDYQLSRLAAVSTCQQIQKSKQEQSIDLDQSLCRGQIPPNQ